MLHDQNGPINLFAKPVGTIVHFEGVPMPILVDDVLRMNDGRGVIRWYRCLEVTGPDSAKCVVVESEPRESEWLKTLFGKELARRSTGKTMTCVESVDGPCWTAFIP